MNFLKNIENLLQNCTLELEITVLLLNKKHVGSVRTLMDFLANKISLVHFGWLHLNDFNKFFPGFIDEVQFIQYGDEIRPNIDEIDSILNWLQKQANNGKQKLLLFTRHCDNQFMATFISRINEVN